MLQNVLAGKGHIGIWLGLVSAGLLGISLPVLGAPGDAAAASQTAVATLAFGQLPYGEWALLATLIFYNLGVIAFLRLVTKNIDISAAFKEKGTADAEQRANIISELSELRAALATEGVVAQAPAAPDAGVQGQNANAPAAPAGPAAPVADAAAALQAAQAAANAQKQRAALFEKLDKEIARIQADVLPTSFSRLSGGVGTLILACFVWGLGDVLLYRAFADPASIEHIVAQMGGYFLGAGALFAPYAANQLQTAFTK